MDACDSNTVALAIATPLNNCRNHMVLHPLVLDTPHYTRLLGYISTKGHNTYTAAVLLFDSSNATPCPHTQRCHPIPHILFPTFPCFFSWLFAGPQYPLVPACPMKWDQFPSVRQKTKTRAANVFTLIQCWPISNHY